MVTIPLTNIDGIALVSDADADLAAMRWYLKKSAYVSYVARGERGKAGVRTVRLHRLIAERMGILEEPSWEIHHVDQNPYNCQRENLEALPKGEHGRVTREQNATPSDDIPF